MIQYTQHLEGIFDQSFCEVEEQCDNWNNMVYGENNVGGFNYNGTWAEYEVYRKRFPDSPITQRFLAMFPDESRTQVAEGPFIHTCEYRALSE